MSPAETAMLTKVLAGAGVLFVIGYIGNLLSFKSRFVNALVTAIVFAAIYAALFYFVDQAMLPPEVRQMSQAMLVQLIATAAGIVFVIDLIANMLSFQSRFVNALMTAIVFAVVFGAAMYFTGGATSIPA